MVVRTAILFTLWLAGGCGGGVTVVAPPPPPRTIREPVADGALPALPAPQALPPDLEGYRPVAHGEDQRRLLLIGPPLEDADTRYPFWHELAVLDLETMKVRALPPVAAVGRLGGEPIYTVRWQASGGRPREPCESVVTPDEQVLVVPCVGLPPPSFAEVVAPPPDGVLIIVRPRPRCPSPCR